MKDILSPDVNGIVREKYLVAAITEEIRKSKLNGYIPANASIHKVDGGKPEEYAHYFISLIKKTTKLKATYNQTVRTYSPTGLLEEVERLGLFSINPLTSPAIDRNNLFDSRINMKEGIRLYANLIVDETNLPEINGVVFI
tara:strand:- start:3347 stop:3769 length:423 start_codon:yes stop_codon:yes gene_type:complete